MLDNRPQPQKPSRENFPEYPPALGEMVENLSKLVALYRYEKHDKLSELSVSLYRELSDPEFRKAFLILLPPALYQMLKLYAQISKEMDERNKNKEKTE